MDDQRPQEDLPGEGLLRSEAHSGQVTNNVFGILLHLAAWAVVAALVLVVMTLTLLASSIMPAPQMPPLPVNQELTGRLLIGTKNLMGDESSSMLLLQAEPLRTGSFEEQLAYTILLSELSGPEVGLEDLERLNELSEEEHPRSEESNELAEIVGALLFASASGERADVLPEEQRAQLNRSLGIYGAYLHARATMDKAELAQLDAETSRGAIFVIAIAGWFLLSFFSGVVVLVVLAIMVLMRMLPLKISIDGVPSRSIYIETFAVWLVLQLVLQVFAGLFAPPSAGTERMLLFSMIAMFASLLALFWPIIRGVPFARMRQECGLYGGRTWYLEIFAGFATYAAALPILLVGLGLSFLVGIIVKEVFGEVPPPAHPIQEAISGSVVGIILIYLLVCVAAPIVEEIIFRGVLYRYLRDGSRRMGWFLSFVLSALVSSFIFAAIHPQGLTFIPVLGALAVAFCIGREWRGSLIAPTIAHAINNGVVMTLNVALLA